MKRLCIICGARVTNINSKVDTCDKYCKYAKDNNVSRFRAYKFVNMGEIYNEEFLTDLFDRNKKPNPQ